MPSYLHEQCGTVLHTSQEMQAHHGKCSSYARGGDGWGYTLQPNAPAKSLQPGARVSWTHDDGSARTGTVWAEAPNVSGPRGGKGKPQRHVVPDGERSAVVVGAHRLTELQDPMTAAKAPPHLFSDRRAV